MTHATRQKQRNRVRLWAALWMLWAVFPAGVGAEETAKANEAGLGLRTDFGDVLIENVRLGATYNLRELCGKPLKVTNTGTDTVNLVMDVQIPTENLITTIRKELGFRPIPAVDWVRLTQTQFIVPPGESAYTDVIITIPNDPSLYGKKFQASIYARTTGKEFLQLGVWSHLHLVLLPSPEAQAEAEKNRKRGVVANMDYTLLPDKLVILNAPVGRKMVIRDEIKRTIMIANSSTEPIELRAKVVPVGDTPLTLQVGYEEPADLNWLTLQKNVFTLEPSSFYDPGLVLSIPKNKAYVGKKFQFVIKVEPADPDVTGITFYGKVYAETVP